MSSLVRNFILLVLVIGMVVAGAALYSPPTPCDRTLSYSIGDFDDRFEITRETLIKNLAQAEAVWEKPMNLNLFAYSATASFKINLIFDERQQNTIEERTLRERIDTHGMSFDSLAKEYDALFASYEQEKLSYEQRLAAYNSQIRYWNEQGGAPKEEYNELEQERLALQTLQDKINSMVRRLNTLNAKIKGLADTHNINVTEYNERYAVSREFDQADYQGEESEINVYQFGDTKELRLALAHEFGHAMELDHVQNPESIMYYLMEKQDPDNPKLSPEDLLALQVACRLIKVSPDSGSPQSALPTRSYFENIKDAFNELISR